MILESHLYALYLPLSPPHPSDLPQTALAKTRLTAPVS